VQTHVGLCLGLWPFYTWLQIQLSAIFFQVSPSFYIQVFLRCVQICSAAGQRSFFSLPWVDPSQSFDRNSCSGFNVAHKQRVLTDFKTKAII
jgi:hypothetical protein